MTTKEESEDFREIRLAQGIMGQNKDTRRYFTIIAKELDWARDTSPARRKDDRYNDYTLYQTKKGKYIVEIEHISRWVNEINQYRFETFDSLQEVCEKYPYFRPLLPPERLDV